MITAQMVRELRDRTGAGMMDSKKALQAADGDMEKAIEILREKGLAQQAKKAGRIASEGVIATYVSDDMKSAGMVEFNCETDFVSAGEEFIKTAESFAKVAAESDAISVEELKNEKVGEFTIDQVVAELIAKIGENMNVRRFEKFVSEDGLIASYTHMNGKIGVLVQVKSDNVNDDVKKVARDVAMHVAATNPLFISKDQVDAETLEKEKEIYRVQALNEGKPANIVEKMVMGRISKYYKEVCLLEQPFVKNPDQTVAQYVKDSSKEFGAIEIVKFARFEKGEGIEKKHEDFAAEVAAQMNQGN